jgi:3-oxoacyl-(acyl-carrier-protein) synthase
MAQESLVGRSKGGAALAAWKLAGLVQSIDSRGIVPDNRNADNIDSDVLFQQYSVLMFPLKTVQTDCNTTGVIVCLSSC